MSERYPLDCLHATQKNACKNKLESLMCIKSNPGQNVDGQNDDGQNVSGQNISNFGNIGRNVPGQNVSRKKTGLHFII